MSNAQAVIVLSRDLFFAMRIRGVLRQLGFTAVLTKSEGEYATAVESHPDAILGVVDFNTPVDWDEVKLSGPDFPVLAFGAHTDVAGFRTAKAAGVTRTVSNGEFDRRFPELIDQYRRAS